MYFHGMILDIVKRKGHRRVNFLINSGKEGMGLSRERLFPPSNGPFIMFIN